MAGQQMDWNLEAYLERVRSGCFICKMLDDSVGYEHHVVHRDEVAVAFLSKYPVAWGHLLVAPVEHREHVVDDFSATEYLRLQRVVHVLGKAISATLPTERLYVLSLGSQQGNRHVHWHLVPLPPGVPYEQQQMALLAESRGWQRFEHDELEALAIELQAAVHSELDSDR